MNITVFGANGAIGKLAVERVLVKGWNLTAYVRRENALDLTHQNSFLIEKKAYCLKNKKVQYIITLN